MSRKPSHPILVSITTLALCGASASALAEEPLPRGYGEDLQRVLVKYPEGRVPASSLKWLSKRYQRSFHVVAGDLRNRFLARRSIPRRRSRAVPPSEERPILQRMLPATPARLPEARLEPSD